MNTFPSDDDNNEDSKIYFRELRAKLEDFPFGEVFWTITKVFVLIWFTNGLVHEVYTSFVKAWWG